ncbi:hypothetical protein AURDEDRAFT_175969 [Auricularia subglabra TFB-10046 SS5]|nr:hypothetical protein AURDEDRAFT_175969 [Auricularia subglabra TFB-10046 SS5]
MSMCLHPPSTPVGLFTNIQMALYIFIIVPDMHLLWDRLEREFPAFPDGDCELFLRIEPTRTLYYFTQWEAKTVFWLDSPGVVLPFGSYAELHEYMRSEFWVHVERFSSHKPLPNGSGEELTSIMAYHLAESNHALGASPFTGSQASAYFQALQSGDSTFPAIDGGRTALVARLWTEVCRARRVNSRKALYAAELQRPYRPPKRVYQLLGLLLLFNEPRNLYMSLVNLFVVDILYERLWRELHENTLRGEWKDHSFMATVTLAANMAFLAIGNVSAAGGNATLTVALSLCSTFLAVGAIVLGKALPSCHRPLHKASVADIANYIGSFGINGDGIYKLAMLYSLPFAVFTWSLVLFVAALLSFTFQQWTWAIGVPVGILALSIPSLLVLTIRCFSAIPHRSMFISDANSTSGPASPPLTVNLRLAARRAALGATQKLNSSRFRSHGGDSAAAALDNVV